MWAKYPKNKLVRAIFRMRDCPLHALVVVKTSNVVILTSSLGPIYTVRFLSHATTAYDMIYDCCVRQKKCRSILKHVLKRCDNRKSCRKPVVSLSHATKIVPCKSALIQSTAKICAKIRAARAARSFMLF